MSNQSAANDSDNRQLMLYIIELEAEVDRLRRRERQVQVEARQLVDSLFLHREIASESLDTSLAVTTEQGRRLQAWLESFFAPMLVLPLDAVAEINLRLLAESVFRSQINSHKTSGAVLRLELASDHMLWFPVRLLHILENLISNAIRYHDPSKGEVRVSLEMRLEQGNYLIRFSDNGAGMQADQIDQALELRLRAGSTRAAGLGVGLAVVKAIVEYCCGEISIVSDTGQGTSVLITLPRFDATDFVESK